MKQKKLKLAIISAVLSLSVFVGVTPLSTNFGVGNKVFGEVSVKAAEGDAAKQLVLVIDQAKTAVSGVDVAPEKFAALQAAIAEAKKISDKEVTETYTAAMKDAEAGPAGDKLWAVYLASLPTRKDIEAAKSAYVTAKVGLQAALETNTANFHKVDYEYVLGKHQEFYGLGDPIYDADTYVPASGTTAASGTSLTYAQIVELKKITTQISDITTWYNTRPVATINTAAVDKKVEELQAVIDAAKAAIADPAYVNNSSSDLRATVLDAEAEIARINAVKATINTDNKHKSQAEIDELFAAVDSSAVAKAVTDELNKFTNGATLISNAVKALEDAIARGNQAVTDFKGDKTGVEFLALEKAIADAKEDLATLKALPATATLKQKEDAVKAATVSEDVKAIDDAIKNLPGVVDPVVVDKKALETGIKEATDYLNGTEIAEANKAALKTAIEAAQKVFDNKDATQAEVDKAVTDLKAALDTAKKPVDPSAVDKTALEAGIKEAQTYLDGKEIAEANKEALKLAIAEAKKVFDNKDATAADVAKAVADLKTALETAKKTVVDPVKVDKSALETAVKEAEALIAEGKLNPEVQKALQEVVDAAKVVLVNKDATQNEINNATSNLKAAISVAKASITGTTNINVVIVIINNYCANICKPLPVDPCKPVDPVKPVGPVDPCKPAVKPADPCTTVTPVVTPAVKPSVTVPAVTPTTVTTKLPQTGGIDPSAIFGLSALMSLAGITLGKKNRK